MRRSLPLLLALFAFLALAQDTANERRIIRIESEGASISGNIRYGPIRYEHPDPEGIVATVSNLTIFASTAILQVPEEEQGDTFLNQATGRREARFQDGVRVERDRLEATGPELVYRESTGLGTLEGNTRVTIEPTEEGEDRLEIVSESVEFDVDTDRSVSRGAVSLEQGPQSATTETLIFEEARALAVLQTPDGQSVVTREIDDGLLTITADEIRILTDESRVYATGNVTVVDGSITTTGTTVFYDDEAAIAEILGEPALSVDDENGVRLESPRIRQDIEFDFVEALDASAPQPFSPADFLLEEERTEAP